MEAKTMEDVLTALTGQVVTVVNPQSYIRTLTGYTIDVDTYNAKLVSFEEGTVKLLTQYEQDPHKKVKERAFQFIHLDQIKRIGISKTEKFIFV